jgi:predicted Zn-dependent protease
VWKKMEQANTSSPPEFLSTHPSSQSRIADLEKAMPRVLPLYQTAHR